MHISKPRLKLGFLGVALFVGLQGMALTAWAQSSAASASASEPEDEDDGTTLSCGESTCRNIPRREKLTIVGTNFFRGIVGGFEQGAGAAGGLQLTTRRAIPAVTFRVNLLASTKLARRVDLEMYVPRIGSSRNHADVWFSYMRMTRNFFGIGSRIPNDFRTDFSVERRSYQASFTRDLSKTLQGGVYTQVVNTHGTPGTDSSVPAIDTLFSATQTDSAGQWVPGLLSFSKILSYGTFLLFDKRDSSVNLTQGIQLYGRLSSFQGLENKGSFDDYGWHEAEFDARGYLPLGGSKTSLAVRSRGRFAATRGGSQIPFYDLAWLGGREYVRGYNTYRFRAPNMLMFSTELRRTVYARSGIRGVDAFAFADSGQVWGNFPTSDSVVVPSQKFSSSNWHSGVGAGVQYRHSRKLAGRIEIGHSNEGNIVYASLTRGF